MYEGVSPQVIYLYGALYGEGEKKEKVVQISCKNAYVIRD